MHRATILSALALAAVLGVGSAAAAEISSVYERFSVEDCRVTEETDREQLRLCDMKNGPDLTFIFHEHGVAVMVEPAGSQGRYGNDDPNYDYGRTGHFGDIYGDENGLVTLEWRVEKVAGNWRPFAAIYRTTYTRYDADGEPRNLQRLDVLAFGTGYACQIGTVENGPGQNEKARAIADALRGTNPCPAVKR
ncbi:MAG TPA: hypothetical protein PLG99_14485 [Kaistiaceae bacterium]|nr:hypothetical protein [Kaistiaceae bacterium]